jgi:transcriptional regulator with XRE-family HTH domain
MVRASMTDLLREQSETLRQAIAATTQTEHAALSTVVSDVKSEVGRVLEQAEKFHQQTLGFALTHARAGLIPTVPTELGALKEELRRQGITHDQVAAEAGVHRTYVVNVLAGRSTSPPVLAAVGKLLKPSADLSKAEDDPPSPANAEETAAGRKATLLASGHNYRDLVRLAKVSYSMADKWMNARRTSSECERGLRDPHRRCSDHLSQDTTSAARRRSPGAGGPPARARDRAR